jgi:peptide deformylase
MHLTKRILKKKSVPYTFDKPFENQKTAVEMINFMQSNGGIGLAAPQVGIGKRLFVMYTSGKFRTCFNPELLNVSRTTELYTEGCLSFNGDFYEIERPNTIDVLYYNYMGKAAHETLTGIDTRCFLHELDHLNGIVFKQRLENKVPKKYNYAIIKSRS